MNSRKIDAIDDPRLARIVAVWAELDAPFQTAILAMIDAAPRSPSIDAFDFGAKERLADEFEADA